LAIAKSTLGDFLSIGIMATHKTLKSVVRSMAESFTSLMNYEVTTM